MNEEDNAVIEEVKIEVAREQLEAERRARKFQEYLSSPEYQDKIKTRIKINDACYRYPDARKKMYAALSKADNIDQIVDSIIIFCETFGFTVDPRPQAYPHDLPFILFQYQKDAIRWLVECIEQGTDGLIEKSRDMGVTWTLFIWVPLWYWLFKDGTNILVGSYKEDIVDNKSKDSLFGMMDYSISSLPKWMLPKGWKKDKHRTHLKIVNPMNWNQITGDTMNPDFGRGTRKTVVLFDELGSWEYGRDAWESAGQSTSCRIANSTPKGQNFYAMLSESGIKKLTLHWKLHPLKDDEWYEFEKLRNSPEAIAQELDISYNKSQEGRVYPEWSELNVTLGDFRYRPDWPLYVFWDFGNSDDTAIIWAQKNPENGKLRIVDAYSSSGKIIDFYVPFITGIAIESGYMYTREELKIIDAHRGHRRATHFGDPAGRFKNSVVDSTVFSVLRDHNINVSFKDEWKEFNKRKGAARNLINRGVELNENNRTKYLNLCMLNASYPRIKNSGVDIINSVKPKHDWTSHIRSAFEYGALGLAEVNNTYRQIYDKFRTKDRGRRAIAY